MNAPTPAEFEAFSPAQRRAFFSELLAEVRSMRKELAELRAERMVRR